MTRSHLSTSLLLLALLPLVTPVAIPVSHNKLHIARRATVGAGSGTARGTPVQLLPSPTTPDDAIAPTGDDQIIDIPVISDTPPAGNGTVPDEVVGVPVIDTPPAGNDTASSPVPTATDPAEITPPPPAANPAAPTLSLSMRTSISIPSNVRDDFIVPTGAPVLSTIGDAAPTLSSSVGVGAGNETATTTSGVAEPTAIVPEVPAEEPAAPEVPAQEPAAPEVPAEEPSAPSPPAAPSAPAAPPAAPGAGRGIGRGGRRQRNRGGRGRAGARIKAALGRARGRAGKKAPAPPAPPAVTPPAAVVPPAAPAAGSDKVLDLSGAGGAAPVAKEGAAPVGAGVSKKVVDLSRAGGAAPVGAGISKKVLEERQVIEEAPREVEEEEECEE